MKALIRRLCDAHGAGGYEQIAQTIKDIMKTTANEVYTDSLGSVIAIRRCGKLQAPLLLLEAHMDEIGFVVTHVDEDGFIHVASCGGIDRRVLAATEVVVLAERGLPGVFCSTPPHLSNGDEKLKKTEDMGIDVGLPVEEVKRLVPKGTRVVFRNVMRELGDNLICGKALDDRVGCAAVIRAMEQLQDETLSCDVAALFAVQEEVGGAGAAVAAFSLTPTMAVATDVSFAHTPDAPAHQCGKLGGGAMLGMAPGLDAELTKIISDLAKTHQLSIQYEVMGDSTGTDADGIAFVKEGVPTALLSIPQRYMHTPVETVDVRDVQSVADLMTYIAKEGVSQC